MPEFSATLRGDDRGGHQDGGMPIAENQDADQGFGRLCVQNGQNLPQNRRPALRVCDRAGRCRRLRPLRAEAFEGGDDVTDAEQRQQRLDPRKSAAHRAPARQGDGQLFLHGFHTGSDRNPF